MLRRWFAETKGTVNVSTVTVTSHDSLAISLLPIFVVVCCLQTYLWHNNEAVVDWLKGELARTIRASLSLLRTWSSFGTFVLVYQSRVLNVTIGKFYVLYRDILTLTQ